MPTTTHDSRLTTHGSLLPLHQDKAGHSHRPPLSHRLAAFARLWRGISAAIVPAVPAAASFFATYEAIKGDANLRRALAPNPIPIPNPNPDPYP